MNEDHDRLCSSAQWIDHLRADVLAPLLNGVQLGSRMIEVGPGPGAATGWLSHRVQQLTAVEADAAAVAALARSHANVEVVHGDASALAFPDGAFDAAGTFTMLHHVPTRELQDRVLAELIRVLRPGGVLVGSDSLASHRLRKFHERDTYNPIPPGHLLTRLQELGCTKITVTVGEWLTFIAHKPIASAPHPGNGTADHTRRPRTHPANRRGTSALPFPPSEQAERETHGGAAASSRRRPPGRRQRHRHIQWRDLRS